MKQVTTNFCGQRLRIARQFRALTQPELAQKVAASTALISLCEAGKKKHPARDLVEACAAVLGFEPAFFSAPLEDVFQEEECNFRHPGTTPERIKAQTRAHATLIGLVIAMLRSRRLFPPINVPRVTASTGPEIEMAADLCRRHWKLDLDGPVQELTEVLEAAGVIVVNHLVKSKKVDTFSRYSARMAVIFPNQEIQSPSVRNFDISHELGHLVMHRGIPTGTTESEQEADAFAGAFLMPSGAFRSEFQALPFSWEHVFRLKKRWNASVAAIVKRAYDLKLLGVVEYRAALKYMYRKGWNKREPHESRFQRPAVLEKVLNGLGQRATLTIDLPIEKFCEELCFLPATFYEVTGIGITPESVAPSSGMERPVAASLLSLCSGQPMTSTVPIPDPTPEPATRAPDPYGVDSIRPGTEELFLLRGADNCELARHCDQKERAVGIEIWHREYMDLPALKTVERFWVVINQSDDRQANTRFVHSIADDISIRERSRIATVVSPSRMSYLFKQILKLQRSRAVSREVLEFVFQFKAFPLPSNTKEIDALTEPPGPSEPPPMDQIFRW